MDTEDTCYNMPLNEVYDAFLILKAVNTVINMGSSRPKTAEKLKKVLQPMTKVMIYNNITDVVTLFNNIENSSLRVPLTAMTRTLSVQNLTKELLEWGENEAKNKNATLLLQMGTEEQSEREGKIKRQKVAKNPTFEQVCKQFFKMNASPDELAEKVIQNLIATGMINLRDSADTKNETEIQYNLPSEFVSTCLRHLPNIILKTTLSSKSILIPDQVWQRKLDYLNELLRHFLSAAAKDQFDTGSFDEPITLLLGNIQYAERSYRNKRRRFSRSRSRSREFLRKEYRTRWMSRSRSSSRSLSREKSRSRSRSPLLRSRSRSRSRSCSFDRGRSRSRSFDRGRSRSPLCDTRHRKSPLHDRSRSRSIDRCCSISSNCSGRFSHSSSHCDFVKQRYEKVRSISRSRSWLQTLEKKHLVSCVSEFRFWKHCLEKSITFKMSDLKKVPNDIIPEAVPIIGALNGLTQKPKTLAALKEVVQPMCNFVYFIAPQEPSGRKILRNLFNLGRSMPTRNYEARVNVNLRQEEGQVLMFEVNRKSILKMSDACERDTAECLNERVLKNITSAAMKKGESFLLGLSDSKMACYHKLKALSTKWKEPTTAVGSSGDHDAENMDTDDDHKMAALSRTQMLQKLIQLCTSRSEIPVDDIINRLKSLGILSVDDTGMIDYNISEDVVAECKKKCSLAKTIMYPIRARGLTNPKRKVTEARWRKFNIRR